VSGYAVEAKDERHARELVSQGYGNLVEDNFGYCDALDPDTWTVERG